MRTAPSSPAGWTSRARRLVTLLTTIVYCCRSSSASANTYGSSCRPQNSCRVHQNAVTPLVLPVSWSWRGVERGGPEWFGRKAETCVVAAQRVPVRAGQAPVGLVEEQQVLTLDREDECFRIVCVAQRVPAEYGVQQEQRERRLRRDPGDAGDRNV